jgi:thioredoxin-like negative regulator of GroEL
MKLGYKSAICAAIITMLIGCSSGDHHGDTASAVPWRSDYATAQAEAQRTHKAVLVDFHASWCGPCQQMEKTTWTDKAAATAVGDYIPVQVDVDQHADIAAKFHVESIPNLVLVDEKGTVLKSAVGYHSTEALQAWLNGKSTQ